MPVPLTVRLDDLAESVHAWGVTTPSLRTRVRGRPSRQDAEALTALVVETGLTLFRTQGYEATTMDAVALRCGVSKHTLYRRFPSKGRLFKAAIEHHAARLIERLESLGAVDADPLEALRQGVQASLLFSTSAEAVEIFRMCIAAVPRFPEVGAQFAAIEQGILDHLEPLVRRAQACGELRPGESRAITSQLYFAMIGEAWVRALTSRTASTAAPDAAARFEEGWARALEGIGGKTASSR